MKVTEDHWLDVAIRKPIPGGLPMPIRRFLIQHFTAGGTAQSSIDFWNTPAAKGANAHIVVDRDGTIYQCRPFNRTCGHAGVSKWTDPKTGVVYTSLNSCSIGIEIANAGDAARENGTAFTRFKLPAGVVRLRHKNGGPLTWWEVYPQAQIDAVKELSRVLVKRYNLDSMAGHDEIAPSRKNDPGPAFPWKEVRDHVGLQQ